MISLAQYVGPHATSPDWTEEVIDNANDLLFSCGILELMARDDGVLFPDNPATGSGVSGQTFGGFRPQDCSIGAARSAHKLGMAVDRYDPDGLIDKWCFENQDKLAECNIYIEYPEATKGWSHWTIRAPKSGHRVFYP